jgi:hypothetical protein
MCLIFQMFCDCRFWNWFQFGGKEGAVDWNSFMGAKSYRLSQFSGQFLSLSHGSSVCLNWLIWVYLVVEALMRLFGTTYKNNFWYFHKLFLAYFH